MFLNTISAHICISRQKRDMPRLRFWFIPVLEHVEKAASRAWLHFIATPWTRTDVSHHTTYTQQCRVGHHMMIIVRRLTGLRTPMRTRDVLSVAFPSQFSACEGGTPSITAYRQCRSQH